MAERVPPESRLGRGQLRPAASPTDTFVRPRKNSSLLQLADSLKGIAPDVGRLGNALGELRENRELRKGAEAASAAALEGKSLEEAQEDGTLEGSGAFKRGANKQFAQLSAFEYGQSLHAFVNSDLATIDDMDEFNSRVQDFTKEWISTNAPDADPEFLRHFQPAIAALRGNAVSQAAWGVGERHRKRVEDQFGTLVAAAIVGESDWTSPEGQRERVISGVASLRQDAYDMGIRGARVNELIAEAGIQVAVGQGRPEVIDAIAMIPTGPNGEIPLGDIPKYTLKFAQATAAAHREALRKDTEGKEGERAQVETLVQEMQNEFITAAENGLDPALINITGFQRRMNELDPDSVSKLEAIRNSFLQGHKRTTVPVIEAEVARLVYGPERIGAEQLDTLFSRGGMNTTTYLKWRGKITSRDRVISRPGPNPDSLMGGGRTMISDAVNASGAMGDEKSTITAIYRTQFREDVYAFLESPEAEGLTTEQLRARIREIAESVIEEIPKPNN